MVEKKEEKLKDNKVLENKVKKLRYFNTLNWSIQYKYIIQIYRVKPHACL